MALDRHSIERKDFPITDRGYDPAAVDAHLVALADELEELKRSSSRPAASLAVSSSEQVRAIIEAAERSASEMRHQAEDEARRIREEASTGARTIREQATAQAREYVDHVSASRATLLQRLEAMEREIGALFESLRTAAADAPAASHPAPEPVDSHLAPEPAFRRAAPEPVVTHAAPEPAASHAAPEPAATEEADGRSEDAESARLIALNMALSNTPREEIDRYLAEHYRLRDRSKLLDEVYESVRG